MRWLLSTIRWRAEPDGGASPVPGPGGEPGTQQSPAPAAEPSTPDRGTQGPPDTIPYGRFKEVNDRLSTLREFEPIVEAGYTPQDLQQLASFGLAYDTDPVGTWARMAGGLDLPQEVKDAIEQHVGSGDTEPGAGEPQPKPDDSQPQLPKEVQFLLDRERGRIEAEQAQAGNEVLDQIINHWGEADKKDGIEVPDTVKLTFIQATLGAGGFESVEQAAEIARQSYVAHREEVLQSAISQRGTSPRPVPGSGVTSTEPQKFANLGQASRAAAAAIERGELPNPVRNAG